jgi:hypothetical protein
MNGQRWFLAAFVCVLFPHVSMAQMAPIFGPKPFVRGTGAPQTLVDTFTNCEPEGEYKLVVANGKPDGTDRGSSATVVVNGVTLVRPNDFDQQVARIEKPLTLGPTNQLEVRLASAPGSVLTISVECTSGCLDVEITSPVAGDDVSRIDTVVRGRVMSFDREVGVTVNGIAGHVRDDSFVVPKVPLTLGTNSLIATVTNSCSQTASRTTTVTKSTEPSEYVLLTGSPIYGVVPLQNGLAALPSGLNRINKIEWDFDGDGAPETSTADADEVTHTYAQAGVFVPTVTVTDANGHVVTDSIVVDAITQQQFDQLLRDKVLALRAAVARGSLYEAVSFVTPSKRSAYLQSFESASNLSVLIDMLAGALTPRDRFGRFAVYDLTRTVDGTTTTSQVVFVLDADGIWRLNQF